MNLLPTQRLGITAALLSAVMFGLTLPVLKVGFGDANPWLLAGLLYLGSGGGLAVWSTVRGRTWTVARRDLPWLAGAVIAGGIVAPVLLLLGLRDIPASTASLFLTCEGMFTSVLAWTAFREHYDSRVVLGFIAIAGGAIVLALVPGSLQPTPLLPAALVLAACLAWGVDNNLTRVVALADPIQIAATKGLVAGLTNTVLAVSMGAHLPSWSSAAMAGGIGFAGYGVSLVLFVVALRDLGTSRASAYFSIAPFIGVLVSVTVLREPFTPAIAMAGVFMGVGVWLHVTEHHSHDHVHDELEHEHSHHHDEHHDHHDSEPTPPGTHAHVHVHKPLRHRHPHFPDAHHRHDH